MHHVCDYAQHQTLYCQWTFLIHFKRWRFLVINVILPTRSASGDYSSVNILLTKSVIRVTRAGPVYFSIVTVTPSTLGALWIFHLRIISEISCSDTVAHIFSPCKTGLAGLPIHSFHPCLSLAANSFINCSPR